MITSHERPSNLSVPDAGVEQQDFVRDQFLSLFLRQNKRAQGGLLLCGVLIFLLLIHRMSGPLPWAWLGSVVVISGARFTWTDRLVQNGAAPLRMVAGLLFLTGICLMLPVLAFDAFADVDRAFVTIALLTTATASVATSSGYRATDPAVAICEPTASSDSKARSPSLKR